MREGNPVIVVEPGPRALGDIVVAGQKIDIETMSLLVRHGGGLVYATMSAERCHELRLPLQVGRIDPNRIVTEARVSVEAREGVTTGISVEDRVRTLHVLSDPRASAKDIVMPGHIFPFAACEGGTACRPRISEAGTDLARLAGFTPVAADAEILRPDGERVLGEELLDFGYQHGIPVVSISSLAAYRFRTEEVTETGLSLVAEQERETRWGGANLRVYSDDAIGRTHAVFRFGDEVDDSHQPPTVGIARMCPLHALAGEEVCICASGGSSIPVLDSHRRPQDVLIQLDLGNGGCELPGFSGLAPATDDVVSVARLLREVGIDSIKLDGSHSDQLGRLVDFGVAVKAPGPDER